MSNDRKIVCIAIASNTTVAGMIKILEKVVDDYLIRSEYDYVEQVGKLNEDGRSKMMRVESNRFIVAINKEEFGKVKKAIMDYGGYFHQYNLEKIRLPNYEFNSHKIMIRDTKKMPHSVFQQYLYELSSTMLNNGDVKVNIPLGKDGKLTDVHRGFGFIEWGVEHDTDTLKSFKIMFNNFTIIDKENYELKASFFRENDKPRDRYKKRSEYNEDSIVDAVEAVTDALKEQMLEDD